MHGSLQAQHVIRHPAPDRRSRVLATLLLLGCGLVLESSVLAKTLQDTRLVGREPDTLEARVTDGLQRRRLYRLAIRYLQDQIDRDDTSAVEQRRLTIRQIHLQTQWALESTGEPRRERFQAALTACEDATTHWTDPQSQVLFEAQRGLTWLGQAQALREEDQWAASSEPGRAQAALEALRRAGQAFAEVENEVPKLLANPNLKPLESWSPDQWLRLGRSALYQRALVALERSYWYEATDRLNTLEAWQQAQDLLDQVAGQVQRDEPLWWEIQLARVRTLRLREQWDEALQILADADLTIASSQQRGDWQAEQIRVAQGLGRDNVADQLAARALPTLAQATPELGLAVLERLLEKFEATHEPALQSQAVAVAETLQQEFGSYWGRRANRLLVERATETSTPTANLAVLIKVADEAYLAGELDEALATYDRAIRLATQRQQASQAARWSARVGAIEQQRQRWKQAAQRFSQAAEWAEEPEQAATYAWLAILNWQTLVLQQDPTQQAQLLDRLEEYLQRYPESPYHDTARLTRATFLWRAGDLSGSLAELSQLSPESTEFSKALTLLSALDQQARQAGVLDQERDAWWRILRPWFVGDGERILETEPERRLAAALIWSQWVDLDKVDQLPQVADVLERLTQLADPQSEVHSKGLLRRLVILATLSGRQDEAAAILPELESLDAEEILAAVEQLQMAAAGLPRDAQQRVGSWEVNLLGRMNRATLTPMQRRRALPLEARAALQAGDSKRAVSVTESFRDEFPDDGTLQRIAAELFTAAGADYRELAQTQWRRVAARSQPRTEPWCAAKYWIIRLTWEAGEAERARQLLDYLKTVPPGWDDWPNAAELDRLDRQVPTR